MAIRITARPETERAKNVEMRRMLDVVAALPTPPKLRTGRPPIASAKVAVTLRLDPSVVERYQALGADWRAKMAEKL